MTRLEALQQGCKKPSKSWYKHSKYIEHIDGSKEKEYRLVFETTDKELAKRIEKLFQGIMDGDMAIEALSETKRDLSEDDLVSRQAAIDAVYDIMGCLDWEARGEVAYVLSGLPSAQPEIIRCKDCKYWTYIKRTDRYWCKTDDGLYDLNPSIDDFCSRAERRTDE